MVDKIIIGGKLTNYLDSIINQGSMPKTAQIQAGTAKTSALSNTAIAQNKPDTFELSTKPKEQKNLKKAIAFGLGAIGVLATGALITKKIISNPSKIFEIIEFKPAETIEEAQEFAIKVLGIKNVEFGDNVEIANWINKGLLNVKNKTKGKCKMPTEIKLIDIEGLSAFVNIKGLMGVSQKCLDSIDNYLKTFARFDAHDLPLFPKDAVEELNRLSDLYRKGELNNLEDKIKLQKLIEQHSDHAENIISNGERLIDNLCSTLEGNGITIDAKTREAIEDLSNIKDLSKEELMEQLKKGTFKSKNETIFEILTDLEKQMKAESDLPEFLINTSSSSAFDTIYHEMGHLHHQKASPIKTLVSHFTYQKNKKFLNDKTQQYIANSVSNYATSDPVEFVAEVYAGLVNGAKYPDKVMELYKKFGGPMIEEFKTPERNGALVMLSKILNKTPS